MTTLIILQEYVPVLLSSCKVEYLLLSQIFKKIGGYYNILLLKIAGFVHTISCNANNEEALSAHAENVQDTSAIICKSLMEMFTVSRNVYIIL